MNLLVQNLHELNKLPCSDHLPIVVTFDIVIDMSNLTDRSAGDVVTSFNWSKVTDHDILSYTRLRVNKKLDVYPSPAVDVLSHK